jgi:hypothetical protein
MSNLPKVEDKALETIRNVSTFEDTCLKIG